MTYFLKVGQYIMLCHCPDEDTESSLLSILADSTLICILRQRDILRSRLGFRVLVRCCVSLQYCLFSFRPTLIRPSGNRQIADLDSGMDSLPAEAGLFCGNLSQLG